MIDHQKKYRENNKEKIKARRKFKHKSRKKLSQEVLNFCHPKKYNGLLIENELWGFKK